MIELVNVEAERGGCLCDYNKFGAVCVLLKMKGTN